MTPTPDFQARTRRYLLGRLVETDCEGFEKELLTSDDLFEEVLIAEDELIDQYLRGELDPEERTAFEQHFLATPDRHEALRFGRAFDRHLSERVPRGKPTPQVLPGFIANQSLLPRTALVGVTLALLVGGLWLLTSRRSAPRTFATLNLTISQGTRADGPPMPTVKLPLPEDALRIVLTLPDRSASSVRYRTELETDSGERRSLEIASQDNRSVTVVIPATDLKPGRYLIKLFAVSPDSSEQRVDGNYFFALQ